ncbi:hypothetical protein Csa_003472 [Cucumis sativus]|nr:hypothetical protein Csa_003472 [Cucumis sativus]
MKFDNNLSSKTQRDLPVIRCASAIDNTKEKVLITRNAEFGVCSEIKLILCLIQQCLEQRVIEKANFDYKPSLILTHIDNQVTLGDVSRDEAILMQGRPQNPLAAVLTGCARESSCIHFSFICRRRFCFGISFSAALHLGAGDGPLSLIHNFYFSFSNLFLLELQ